MQKISLISYYGTKISGETQGLWYKNYAIIHSKHKVYCNRNNVFNKKIVLTAVEILKIDFIIKFLSLYFL